MDTSEREVALITGTSAGIGKATAIAFQEAGFITFATAPELDSNMDELKAKGCQVVQLDVTDENSRVQAVKAAERVNGSISILVNNAGYGQYGPIEEIPLEAIREQFEVNVFGLIGMCQLVLPGMRRAGFGRIINVSSVAGEINEPGSGIYHTTKHAVEAIDQTLRMEVSTFGVNVIGVLPGPVSTEFADKAVAAIPNIGPESPYFVFKQNLEKYTREMLSPDKTSTLTPDDVAETILKAATAKNPSTNYHVGMMSKTMAAVGGIMPDKIWDAVMQRQIPVDKKI